jgi:ATP-dependent DNA helicase DinG
MGLTPIRQGGDDGSNKQIAATFKDDEHSVLFALKSFFTGVDFSGDTCRLVVIDKLPFPVPTEPVFQARSEQIERNGGNSFGSLTIPAMTLTLEQGYGRLIRSKSDKGVVAILDSRLTSTGYGKKIVRSLPDSPVTTDLSRVQSFFEG